MQHKLTTLAVLAGLSISGAAQATLIDRGRGLIYDDVLNVTWLQNANLAATTTYGLSGIGADGSMSWDTARAWIINMNANLYLGYGDWRLPRTAPLNGIGLDLSGSYAGDTDYGYNISAPGTKYAGSTASEMANLYYSTLGNPGSFTPAGTNSGCYAAPSYSCLQNTGPFQNVQSAVYWSDTPNSGGKAWSFATDTGFQSLHTKSITYIYAWAVRTGDVAAVPEPDSYALLLAGLGLVGMAARRRPHPCCT